MTRRGSEAESRQLLLAEDRVKHCQTKLSHLPTFFFHFEEPTVFYYFYIQQDAYLHHQVQAEANVHYKLLLVAEYDHHQLSARNRNP